jgi:AraC-like DNA-binding protein
MSVTNLPHDLFPDEKGSGHVIIHDYSAVTPSFKGKSILHTNAISLVISGEKTMHFADRAIHINNEAFHFLSAGNCLASMDLSRKGTFRSVLLFFDHKVLTAFYLKYDALIHKIKAHRSFPAEAFVSIRKDEFVRNYIESLTKMLAGGVSISPEMRLLKFEELMLHLLEHFPEQLLSFQPPEKKSQDDLDIRKAVESNITNVISIEELAFLCNISPSTFKRRFAKIYNTSPNKWFLQKRMEIAKNLLEHYHEKPGEVYHKVGYENHSSFTQSFKQVYGITPKDFQQQKMNVQL